MSRMSFQCCRRLRTTLAGAEHRVHAYPFPAHPLPTPHQIFHLPTTASLADIKSRYYDLVRHHHPDSSYARAHTPCPIQRHTRFQSILSAYHSLRHPSSSSSASHPPWTLYGHGPGFDPYIAEINRRRRTSINAEYLKRRKQAMEDEERKEWSKTAGGVRERMMLAFAVVILLGGLYPGLFLVPFEVDKTHRSAVSNLTQARDDAKEVGRARREEVRRRVKLIKAAKEQGQERQQ